MSQVPAATRTLRVLRFLARRPDPVSAGAHHAGLRPAAEHGVPPAARHGRGGLRGPPGRRGALRARPGRPRGRGRVRRGRRRWRGSPGARWPTSPTSPVTTPTSPCSTAVTCSTSIEERAAGRPSLVTDVGVRLPAHLTASGRAILAALPAAQVRALYPRPGAVHAPPRHRAGLPQRAADGARRDPAARSRRPRTATSRPGFASVAAAVLDHTGYPVARWPSPSRCARPRPEPDAEAVRRTAAC